MTTVHEIPGFARCALLARKGTCRRNQEYNAKGSQSHEEWIQFGTKGPNYGLNADWIKFGEPRQGQGSRTDIQEFLPLIQKGCSDIELAEANFGFYIRSSRVIDRLRQSVRPTVIEGGRKIFILYGVPGTGKSQLAYTMFPNIWELPILEGTLWFDSYNTNYKDVLIDEFTGNIRLDNLLKMIDNYYVRLVPFKGGFVWWNPNNIVITSNVHPCFWYDYNKQMHQHKEEALRRRITSIYHFTNLHECDIYEGQDRINDIWPLGKAKFHFDGDKYTEIK